MLSSADSLSYRAGCLATVLLGVASCEDTPVPSQVEVTPALYQARYDVVIESAARRELSHGMIRVALPVVGSADVEMPDVTDARVVQDGMGNRQMVLSMDTVPVDYQRLLSVVVTVADRLDAKVAPAQSPVNRYLSAESLVETDAPALREKSIALRGHKAADTVASVGTFIATLGPSATAAATQSLAENPPGSTGETVQGALATLRSGSAGPVDRVLLTLALLRAASIPARAVAGFVDNGDGVLADDEMRVWVEYFSEKGWLEVDEPGEGLRSIVFRIFSNAEDIAPGKAVDNFYQAAGLRIRSVQ